MAEVKGKFISLSVNLMSLYPEAQKQANEYLKEKTGKDAKGLDLEGWYDTKDYDYLMNLYASVSRTGIKALVTLGKNVYPTIKRTVGLPEHLKTPLDFIKFEADGFLMNHRGLDVLPRKFIKVAEGEVIMKAVAPGYNEKLYEGVFLGILEMIGIKTGKVENLGDSVLKITW